MKTSKYAILSQRLTSRFCTGGESVVFKDLALIRKRQGETLSESVIVYFCRILIGFPDFTPEYEDHGLIILFCTHIFKVVLSSFERAGSTGRAYFFNCRRSKGLTSYHCPQRGPSRLKLERY